MQNIDEMMEIWKNMDGKLSCLVEENKRLVSEIKKNKLKSSKDKLIRKYQAFIILAAVCIPLLFLVLVLNPMVVPKYRFPALIYFICFFLGEIGVDAYLLHKLNSIDIYNDTIIDIAHQAETNWKIHKIAIIIGIPVVIGAVILFCMALGSNIETIWGVCVGGAIGLGIGIKQFFNIMKNYKIMTHGEE